ncbi:MAG: hydrogenase maturation protease [Woeseiaceae bacterium]|nr:hydrogenase maturation protease [Woeseiaceae bacterium]
MGRSADPALTVFAWGNISRGDDAIGPMLAEALRDIAPPGIRVIEDHQLNIEHVTDISIDGLVLFIDASVAIESGCQLQRIGPVDEGNFSTHAISPQALLNVFEKTIAKPAPDAWLLHVAAREFELGASIGSVATAAVDEATRLLGELCATAPDQWRAFLERNTRRMEGDAHRLASAAGEIETG